MKVALANGVLGEKLMVDSVYNCLVNDQGETEMKINSIHIFKCISHLQAFRILT